MPILILGVLPDVVVAFGIPIVDGKLRGPTSVMNISLKR